MDGDVAEEDADIGASTYDRTHSEVLRLRLHVAVLHAVVAMHTVGVVALPR